MAKGRKPAITGMARPEGLIDDILIPVARGAIRKSSRATTKVARKVDPRHTGRAGARKVAAKVGEKASKADKALTARQLKMYEDKMWKGLGKWMDSSSPARYVDTRRGRRTFVKTEVAAGKAHRMKNPVAASKKNPQFYETPREAGKAAKKDAKKTVKELRGMTLAQRNASGYIPRRDYSKGYGKNARNVRFK